MKEDIVKYHPNGRIKHRISYYHNDSIYVEMFRDEDGEYHRENNLPDYQLWYDNGRLKVKTYTVHGENNNINNPAGLGFHRNGKINWKDYYLYNVNKGLRITKLSWMNNIKNI